MAHRKSRLRLSSRLGSLSSNLCLAASAIDDVRLQKSTNLFSGRFGLFDIEVGASGTDSFIK